MPQIETVPNQKIVKIHKEPCNKSNKYTMINLEALQKAMRSLSNAELEVWLYFAKNQDGYESAVSPKDAKDNWNIATTTFHRTMQKFEKEGYLVPDHANSNRYTFYEVPEKGISFEDETPKKPAVIQRVSNTTIITLPKRPAVIAEEWEAEKAERRKAERRLNKKDFEF